MVRPVLVETAVAVLLLPVLVAALWVFQRHLIYLPADAPAPPAASVLPGARDVLLRTADGLDLQAWHLPAAQPGAAAVLVASGNAGSREMRAPLARSLAEGGLSVLLFDYRGYAGNPGRPSEHGLALDARAARSFLLEQAGVAPDRLLYYGESLGAAVVTALAAEQPPAGLVLRSPFVDLAGVGRIHYPLLPVRALLWDRYPVLEQIAAVTAPTTVVYGSADSVVPPEQSRRVAAAAGRLHQVLEIPGANHNDRVLLDGPALITAVLDLARRTAA